MEDSHGKCRGLWVRVVAQIGTHNRAWFTLVDLLGWFVCVF